MVELVDVTDRLVGLKRHPVNTSQWCYSGVTVVLQWRCSGVAVVLQWHQRHLTDV